MTIYLNHAIMEEISNPWNCCIAMFVVQVSDFFLDDIFSIRATLRIVIQQKITFTCVKNTIYNE